MKPPIYYTLPNTNVYFSESSKQCAIICDATQQTTTKTSRVPVEVYTVELRVHLKGWEPGTHLRALLRRVVTLRHFNV